MKNIFIIINIVLLTFIAFIAVQIMYKGIELSITNNSLNLKKQASIGKINKTHVTFKKRNYNKIIKNNIFKVITDRKEEILKNKKENDEDITNLKATSLDLKLLGTVAGGSQEEAYAVIEDKRKREQSLFQVGQTVQGAKVLKIYRQKVILNYNDEDQVLEMDFLYNDSLQPHLNPKKNSKAENHDKKTIVPTNVDISRSSIDDSIKDINQLMEQARIRPHFNNGNPDGLLLFGIKPESLFSKMLLEDGDIIIGINGEKLQSVDDALKLYQSLKEASDVNLQIKRHGRTEEINYHVRE